jgi:subtilisin-like proprotein convertase family protein
MRNVLLLSLLTVALAGSSAHAQVEPVENRTSRQTLTEAEIRIPLNQVVVQAPLFATPDSLAASLGLPIVYRYRSDSQTVVLQTESVDQARALALEISGWQGYSASPVHRIFVEPMAFTPNDPYFVPVSGFTGQWHLRNTVNPSIDVNIDPAWATDVTGLGVIVGIVDDSVEGTHPDLSPNFSAANSYDFADQDPDPAPALADDRHGISVAGVAAGRGGNGIGTTGAAPFATIAGLRVGFGGGSTDAEFADAVKYRSQGAIQTIRVKNHSYGYNAPFIADTLSRDALELSAQSGTIHSWSAGNSRGTSAQDTGKHIMLTSPWVIVTAALGYDGVFSNYSSWGSSVTVTAPSSDSGNPGITTTDRTGTGGYNGFVDNNYTAGFGGTSSSSPLVAGCLALLKQVAPNANVRVAKHLIARTAGKVNPTDTSTDGGWRTNAAGINFNANYGFGIMDAGAMVDLGKKMNTHYGSSSISSGTVNVAAGIPDNNATGISRTFVVAQNAKVEDVEVNLNVSHTFRGNIAGFITSPSGLKARFFTNSASDSGDNIVWRFLVNHFWGENTAGTWTIQLADLAAGTTGTWNNFSLKINTGQLAGARTINGQLNLLNWEASSAGIIDVNVYPAGGTTPITTVPATVNATGGFSVAPVLPDGTYDIAIKKSHWLRDRINGLVFSNGNSVSAQTWNLINGDANGDNSVDLLDYFRLSDSYNLSFGDVGFDAEADFNGDSSVDLLDYFILSDNYGVEGE